MRALIIEDDDSQAGVVRGALTGMGYACDVAGDGEGGLRCLKSGRYDLAIVDVVLPDISGLEVIRRARACGQGVPIIVLSAKGEPDDVMSGLDSEADMYLAKPCGMDVLMAHVRALMRRAERTNMSSEVGHAGIVLNRRTRRAVRNGRDLPLSAFEFNLLELLLSNRGTVITYERIKEEVWTGRRSVTNHNIAQAVEGLRAKLADPGEKCGLIENKRGYGYVVW